MIASRRTENTRKAYTADFSAWLTFCYSRGHDPGEPSLPVTVLFRAHLEENFGPATVARVLATCSILYRGFQANDMVRRNPFDRTVLPRPPKSKEGKTPAVPEADALKILAAAEKDTTPVGRRDYAVLRLLYDTGIRRSSLVSLQKSLINRELRETRIFIKGSREEKLNFPPESLDALDAWLVVAPEGDLVFDLDLATVNRIVSARAKKAGVPHVHPHCFRASFITDAYTAKVPEKEIQGAAHHARSDTTSGYNRNAHGGGVADAVADWRRRKR
jgi:integrase